jgi:hypothetical protein
MGQIRRAGDSPVSYPSPIPEPPPKTDPTVYVNGKPVAHNVQTSRATNEAATSKTAEQKLAGQAQEVRLREQLKLKPNDRPSDFDANEHGTNMWTADRSGTVRINGQEAVRKDDLDCGDSKKPQGNQAGDEKKPQGGQGHKPDTAINQKKEERI